MGIHQLNNQHCLYNILGYTGTVNYEHGLYKLNERQLDFMRIVSLLSILKENLFAPKIKLPQTLSSQSNQAENLLLCKS